MKYLIDVSVLAEGKTVVRVRAEGRTQDGTVVAIGDGKAQSVAKAVGIALEGVWDSLVPLAIVQARKEITGAREEEAPGGALPDNLGSLFTSVGRAEVPE